ncbi:unnamed protein product [Mytilus edulis]|uniref:Mutator-like transposase domain-containing protein n=1 Tax=Mytilus edulis TaxID=6550 RepID=A0A8S3QJ05_MYTED|nr:unnamed protein product [Mytilus edulis]
MFPKGSRPFNKGLIGLQRGRVAPGYKYQNSRTPWNKVPVSQLSTSLDPEENHVPAVEMNVEQPNAILDESPCTSSTSPADNDRKQTRSQLLVPSADLKTEEEWCSTSGMRFVDHEEMMKMLNTVITNHTKNFRHCKNPEILAHKQEKWGVCWKYTLRCKNCTYMSPLMKLYKEIVTTKPGTNPGAPNVAVAAAIQDCPMGSTKLQELLARMNCPPPSRTSMHRMTHNVGKELVQLNTRDMAEKLEIVKAKNQERGLAENEINVTVDGRYNSQTITSRKKPGLNATQGFALAMETTTENKYIVASFAQNQMCWKGAWLRGKGFKVECPNGHEDCTANLHRAAPLSEYEMGKEIGTQLALQDILVKNATTDGDGRAAKGIDDATRALHPMWKVERLADYVHLGQSQFRASLRAKFSESMFYGRTKEIRKEMKKAFSQDVKCRSSMIIGQLMEKHNKVTEDVCKDLPKVLEATLRCYDGDCSMCKQYSVVCTGDEGYNWWTRSKYLGCYNITVLQMDEKDKLLLQEILKMKLSEQALNSMKLYDTTNKNEGVHRALSVNLPKNVIHSRGMQARLASGIHRNNNKPGTSAKMKCEHLGVNLSESSLQFLSKMDSDYTYKQEYEKKPEVKRRRLIQTGEKILEHREAKQSRKKCDVYRKGQLDPVPALCKRAPPPAP